VRLTAVYAIWYAYGYLYIIFLYDLILLLCNARRDGFTNGIITRPRVSNTSHFIYRFTVDESAHKYIMLPCCGDLRMVMVPILVDTLLEKFFEKNVLFLFFALFVRVGVFYFIAYIAAYAFLISRSGVARFSENFNLLKNQTSKLNLSFTFHDVYPRPVPPWLI